MDKKSNKRNTFKDIAQTFIIKIIYLLGSFVVSIMLARLLGPSGKGMVAALFVMPNLLTSLADLGVRQAAAYTIGQGEESVQDVFSSSLVIWLTTSVISIAVFAVYLQLYSTIDFSTAMIAIGIIYIPVKILDAYYYGVHQGLQQIGVMNSRHVIAFSVRLFSIIILVWMLNTGVEGAAVAMIISLLFVGIFSYMKTKNQLKFSFKYKRNLPKKLLSRGVIFALALFILNINYRIDILVLERFVSSADLGIYTTASGLAELVWQLPSAIAVVIFSSSANQKDDDSAITTTTKTVRVSLFISLIGSIVFAMLSSWIVPFLYGEAFRESAVIINLLLPGIVIIIIVQIIHATLSGRGYPLMGFSMLIVGVIVNIILNTILIPVYGIHGAAVASTISYTIGGLGFSYIFSKKMAVPLKDFLIIKKTDIRYIIHKIKPTRKK